MEVNSKKKSVFISLPKKHMAAFAKDYELHHGLIIKGLNHFINAGYVQAYFKEWGVVTRCKILKIQSEENEAMAYVRFSSEDEADQAEWAGPHDIGGEVEVKRVVSPKTEEDSDEENSQQALPGSRSKRSVGLGYLLEDPQWLDDEEEEEEEE